MIRRYDIDNKLRGETLVRKGLMKKHAGAFQLKIIPDLNVVKIGGHGIIDFGREVVFPLMEEIGELSRKHKLLIVTGGGARVRHILDVGIDLGMPTGGPCGTGRQNQRTERDHRLNSSYEMGRNQGQNGRPSRPPHNA